MIDDLELLPNPEYKSITEAFKEESVLATTSDSAVERDGIAVWVEQTIIETVWNGDSDSIPDFMCIADATGGEVCSTQVAIPIKTAKINFIDFAPGRNDVLIVATGQGVFVIEIDGRSKRTVIPLYIGQGVEAKIIGGKVYIKDASRLFAVQL